MSLLDPVEQLRAGLDYHLSRHNVLVSNLAQAETPNYKPVDLARSAEFGGHLELAMTSSEHLGGTAGSAAHGTIIEGAAGRVGPDGNGVDVDREAVKIATNQLRYDALAQLASTELAALEWAATDGRGG